MPTFCDGLTRRAAIRVGVAALLLVGAACMAVRADDQDPVKEKLFAAKVAYDGELREYRKLADEWFDKREETARKDGSKKLVDQVKGERKLFDETGELPKVTPTAIQQKPALAKKALEVAYEQAVKDYIRAKKDDQAAAIEAQLKEFRTNLSGTNHRSADVTTKEDLQKYLADTSWTWGDGMKLKSDGTVDMKLGDKFAVRWEALDRRTAIMVFVKGRDVNRTCTITFSEDLTQFGGYSFEGTRLAAIKRKP